MIHNTCISSKEEYHKKHQPKELDPDLDPWHDRTDLLEHREFLVQ